MLNEGLMKTYLGAFLYTYTAMNKNTMLGIQTAIAGGTLALIANVADTVWNMI